MQIEIQQPLEFIYKALKVELLGGNKTYGSSQLTGKSIGRDS
jgi:hypothetical protein